MQAQIMQNGLAARFHPLSGAVASPLPPPSDTTGNLLEKHARLAPYHEFTPTTRVARRGEQQHPPHHHTSKQRMLAELMHTQSEGRKVRTSLKSMFIDVHEQSLSLCPHLYPFIQKPKCNK